MATRTETIQGATVFITDDGAPSVRVTIPHPQGPISNWDTVPEWNGRVNGLTIEEIEAHPTVARLLTARPGPA